MPDTPGENTISFRHEKSSFHRVIHVDGAYGGPAPGNQIHIALYSELNPVPDVVTHSVTSEAQLGEEVHREQRGDVLREVEATVVMRRETAQALHEWLGKLMELMDSEGDEQ